MSAGYPVSALFQILRVGGHFVVRIMRQGIEAKVMISLGRL